MPDAEAQFVDCFWMRVGGRRFGLGCDYRRVMVISGKADKFYAPAGALIY